MKNTNEDIVSIKDNNAQAIDNLRKGFEDNISNIISTNITINENFNGLQIKSEETIKALEEVKNNHQQNIDSEKERVDNIIDEMKELDDSITEITADNGRNTENISELQNMMAFDKASMVETKQLIQEIDSKLNGLDAASTDRLMKAEENIKTNVKQISLLEGSSKNISEQVNNLFQTNVSIDTKIQELHGKSENDLEGLKNKLENMEDGNKYNIEKISGIEEAMQLQNEKLQFIQILDDRMKVMDDEKQKSDANARKDLEESNNKNYQAIEVL